jgi:predicted phage terminase large subunit-like protein
MTRWHPDDLAGRLLETEGDQWKVISLPALAEENDPLGRAPGEPLWADDSYGHGANGRLLKIREDCGRAGQMRDWWSLWQQSPRVREGGFFQIGQIAVEWPTCSLGSTIRAWDLAATKESGGRDPDWTVGLRMSRLADGRYFVSNVKRLRGDPAAVEAAIVETAQADGRGTKILLPQDPGAAGKLVSRYLTSRLAGYDVQVARESGAKATRAGPIAAQVNIGNVLMAKGAWNTAFLEELEHFPNGAHDDQVDALSAAAGWLFTRSTQSSSGAKPWVISQPRSFPGAGSTANPALSSSGAYSGDGGRGFGWSSESPW